MRAVKWENANEHACFLQAGRVSPKELHINAAHKYKCVISLFLNAFQFLLPHVTSEPVATSSGSKLYRFPCVRLGARNWHQDPGYHLSQKLLATNSWEAILWSGKDCSEGISLVSSISVVEMAYFWKSCEMLEIYRKGENITFVHSWCQPE